MFVFYLIFQNYKYILYSIFLQKVTVDCIKMRVIYYNVEQINSKLVQQKINVFNIKAMNLLLVKPEKKLTQPRKNILTNKCISTRNKITQNIISILM